MPVTLLLCTSRAISLSRLNTKKCNDSYRSIGFPLTPQVSAMFTIESRPRKYCRSFVGVSNSMKISVFTSKEVLGSNEERNALMDFIQFLIGSGMESGRAPRKSVNSSILILIATLPRRVLTPVFFWDRLISSRRGLSRFADYCIV